MAYSQHISKRAALLGSALLSLVCCDAGSWSQAGMSPAARDKLLSSRHNGVTSAMLLGVRVVGKPAGVTEVAPALCTWVDTASSQTTLPLWTTCILWTVVA